MRTRLIAIALVLLVVGALTAIVALWARTPHYHASVGGQLLITGGPAPGKPRPSEGEVTATNPNGQTFTAFAPATGMFTLHLPAGTYSLTGSSPQFGSGKYKCMAQQEITIFNGMSTHANVFCPEK